MHMDRFEKNVGASTLTSLHARSTHQLQTLKMEGSMMRRTEHAKRTSHLSTEFRHQANHKQTTNTRRTQQTRDKHADNSPVAPHCPHCPTETETHEHALVDCPHNTSSRCTLLYEVNLAIRKTTSTLYRQGMQDVGRLSTLLAQTTNHPFLLTDGWKTWYTDKHG